jgi:hypothetical protein
VIYLYAITEPVDSPLPAGAVGLDDARLCRVREGVVAGVCSVHRALEPEASEAEIARHAAVVEAVAAQEAVLPVRFGAVFRRGRALRGALAARGRELADALARVTGRVEVGVHVHRLPPEPVAAVQEGAAYLRARAEERRRARGDAEEIHGRLSGLAADATLRVEPTPGLLLSAAYLVDRDAVERFTEEVRRLDGERPETFLCTGPWPPYSFAPHKGEDEPA